MNKPIIMLLLCRRVIADLLIRAIEKKGVMEAFGIYDYKNAVDTALSRHPDIALVEIPEQYGSSAQNTLLLCGAIKAASPGCKIAILCPEKDEAGVNACIEAKQAGRIEDYFFYDSGVDYLVSKLQALLPVNI
jgi:DNA-binding NarL/FixJ family response regulator